MKPSSPFRLARTGTLAARILAGSIATLLAALSAQADTIYWDGTGTDWDLLASWDTAVDGTGGNPALIPGSADLASFSINTINLAQTVNLNADQSALGLVFLGTNTATTLLQGGNANHAITLGTSGITIDNLAGAVTIGSASAGQNVAITLGGAQAWTNNSANGLTIQNAVANGGNLLTVGGSGNTTINGVLSGTGGLTKADGGTLTISAAPTYSGGTTVNGGTLAVQGSSFTSNGNLGTLFNMGNVTVNTGATFLGDRSYFAGTLTLDGGTWTENNGSGGAWTGSVVLNSTSTINSGNNQTIVGDITGAGGLTKTGGSILTLNGDGTYLGSTTISVGTLQLGSSLKNGTISGNITNNATLTFSNAGAQTHSGAISGAGVVNVSGAGTLTMSVANTYTGSTTVTAGVLSLNDAAALPGGIDATGGVGESALTLNGGVIGLTATSGDFLRDLGTGAGQVQWTGNGGFTAYGGDQSVNLGGASAALTWASGSFVSANLLLSSFDSDSKVTFQNPIDLNGSVRTVTVANGLAAADAELSGLLSGAAGGINKAGAGTLLLSGANTYAGATTIAQGILMLGAAGDGTNTPLGTIAGNTTVSAIGGALDVGGITLSTAEPLTLNGSGLSSTGALTNSGAAATFSGPITLASAAAIGSTSGKLTVTGGIGGAFGLTFAGSGDTTISTTAINANVPLITKLGSPSGAGNLTIDVASTLMMAPISVNAGTFTLSGNGQLGDVAGSVTYASVSAGRTDQQSLSSATLPAGFNVGSFVMGQMIYNISGTNTNTSGNPVGFAAGAQTFHSGVMALPGGAVAVDNSGTNLNYRFGGNAGTVGRAIGLGGATLTFTPSAAGAVAENLSGLVFMQGHSVVTLNADAGFQTDIKAAILNRQGTTTETALIRGSSLGTAAGAGISTLTFTAAPTFIGQTGAAGTTNKGILPYVIVDSSATGFGTSFATTSAAGQIVRPLNTGTEMVTNAYTANTNILLTGAQPAIAADTSINSLTINSGNVTITNPAFPTAYRTLTISSGGLLATASSTISGGIVTGANPLNIFTPGANAAANVLTISSRITGTALVKAGGGTLLLSSVSPAFPGYSQNSFSSLGNHAGNIFLNEGTTKLGAHNALGNTGFTTSGQNDGNSMTLNPGAILDLNGKTQFIGALSSGFSGDASPTGPLGLTGGTITGTGGAIMLTTGNPGGGPVSFVYAGSVTGSVGFAVVGGTARQDLTGPNSSSGPILIAPTNSRTDLRDYGTMSGFSELSINNGNGLRIDNTQLANINNRLNATGTLRLNSGQLDYRGRAQTLSTEAFGTVSADTGNSTINIQAGGTNVNSAELTIGTLTRSSGATLNFTGGTFGQTGTNSAVRVFITSALTGNVALTGLADNQIIPGVVIGGDLASYNATTGIGALGQAGFPSYNSASSFSFLGPVSYANYNGSGAVLSGGQTINALKPNGAITFANSGDILTLTSGMVASSGQAFGTTSVRGGLTSATSELILHSNGGNTTVNSVVSGANKLVLAGGGTYTLTANNLHTGGTTVDGGTLALTNNGLPTPLVVGIPAATVPANGLVLSGATATLSNSAGQIDAANIVTLNGGSTLNLMGNNTLAGLVLNNISSTVPVVNTTPATFGATTSSADITLTLTGGITSTSNNINSGAGATINGRVSLPSNSTINVGAGTFNGLVLNPWSTDLSIKGLTGGGGTITKSGIGNLRLDTATTITGTLDVTGGGLLVGAAGAGARFANVVLQDGTNLNLNGFAGTFGSLATDGTGTGFVTNTGGASTLTVGFSNDSTTFAGSFQRRDDSTVNLINLTKIGTGTMTLTGNTSTASGTMTINSTSGGGVKFLDNGVNNFVQGAITVNAGSTLTLDDSGSANLNNRLGNVGVTLSGGSFVSTANAAGSTETTTGALTLNTGESTVTLNQGAVSNVTTFGSLGGLGTGSSATFAGTGIGTATNKLVLTGAPTLTNNILPRLAVGTDFATYNQNGAGAANTNGIQAVTAYSAATNINTAANADTLKTSTTTTLGLTAAKTINAININTNVATVGTNGSLLPTQGLTVSSGGFIVNGTAATISTPVLALGAEGIFRVNSGQDLTVSSRITGTAGLTKTGAGDMTLSKLQDYTGTTTVNQGTLKFGTAVGKNPLLVTVAAGAPTLPALQVNGGTLDLNGNSQLVGTINSSNPLAGGGGTITNSSATAATLNSFGGGTFGGQITGNLNLTLANNSPIVGSGNTNQWSTGTYVFRDQQSYTGDTVVRGANLTLQDKGALTATPNIELNESSIYFDNTGLNPSATPPARVRADVAITLNQSGLNFNVGASADNAFSFGTVNVGYGQNLMNTGGQNNGNTGTALGNGAGATQTVTIGNLVNLGNGGFLNFIDNPGNQIGYNTLAHRTFITSINGNTVTAGSMLPAWVTMSASNTTDFTALSSTGSGIVRYGDTTYGAPAYITTALGGNQTGEVHSSAAVALGVATSTVKALKLTGALTFSAPGNSLNLESGGLITTAALSIGDTTNRGVLTAGGTAASGTTDLILFSPGGNLTVNSVIADTSTVIGSGTGKVRLVIQSFGPFVTLTGNNTYTGGTFVDTNTSTTPLVLSGAGVIIPAGGLTLNGTSGNGAATLTTTATGQIATSNDVTLRNSGYGLTMLAGGTDTLSSLIFNNQGGAYTSTVTTGANLILSGTGPQATASGYVIDSTNHNLGSIPTIAGTLLTIPNGATINTAGDAPTNLIISAPLATAAATLPLHKTGTGSVIFSTATNAFANGVNLDGGSIVFTANSTGTGGVAPTSSQIGTGTLTIGNGTAIMSDNNRSIGNVVNVANNASFTFGTLDATNARANATNNLTLTNTVTLGTGAHTINVNGLNMTGTISGQLTGGTNFAKGGPGTLILSNAANNFGGTVTINGGTLQHNVAGSIPTGRIMTIASGAAFNMNAIGQSIDSLNGAGSVINPGSAATLTVNGSTNGSFSGVLAATTPANLSLIKDGANTQTLSGANTYTGTTTVTNGTLAIGVGGSLANTTVSVGTTGTLAGVGTIGGSTTIQGIHSPGSSAGLQTFTNGLAYASTSTLLWELMANTESGRGPNFDAVDVTGGAFSITSGATLDLSFGGTVSFVDSFWNAAHTWTIADLGIGLTGDGGSDVFTLGSITGGSYSPSEGTFTVTRVADGNLKNDVVLNWTASASSPYQTWIDSYVAIPVGDRDPEDDYDNDGVTNLSEFAFKGVPNDASNRGLFFNEAKDNADGDSDKELTFTCAVRRSAVNFAANGDNAQESVSPIDEVTYTIEGSTTLTGTWNSVVSYVGKSDTAPSGSGLPSLAATDWEYRTFSAFNSMANKGFLRTKVVK